MLIDTPGFSDTNKDDDTLAYNMVLRLQEVKYINAIFIVLNG
jgi:hypothetical protein